MIALAGGEVVEGRTQADVVGGVAGAADVANHGSAASAVAVATAEHTPNNGFQPTPLGAIVTRRG